MINELLLTVASASWLFEIARVLVRLTHVASHRKRRSQHHVIGCETLRIRLRC